MSNPIIDKARSYTIGYSGGKDSTALWIYLTLELGLTNVFPVFADTGWEHDETYKYLDYIETKLGKLYRVQGPHTFVTLAVKKKRFPSAKARFCTEELKLKPMRSWLLGMMSSGQITDPAPIMCSGIRHQESPKRAGMVEWEDADSFYHLPQWRPIIRWTADEVFAMHKKHGIEPNPLYKQGMGRVGCMPCIMTNLKEVAEIGRRFPEVVEKCAAAEAAAVRNDGCISSIWAVGDIPEQHCSRRWTDPKTGITHAIPTARDVFAYAQMDRVARRGPAGQMPLFAEDEEYPSCHSIYGLCE